MSLHCLTHPWSRMAMGRESQASCRGIPPFLLENGYGTTYSRITLDSGVSPPCLRHRIRVVVRVLLCVLWMGLCCLSGASVCICFFGGAVCLVLRLRCTGVAGASCRLTRGSRCAAREWGERSQRCPCPCPRELLSSPSDAQAVAKKKKLQNSNIAYSSLRSLNDLSGA